MRLKRKSKSIIAPTSSWTFGKDVYKNFDDHINSSIPLYEWAHELGLQTSCFFIKKNSNILDIGCSTGTFIKKLNIEHKNKKPNIIGIDLEKNMVKKAKINNKKYKSTNIKCGNLLNFKFSNLDFVTSYFTFSFINPRERQSAYDKVFNSLNWGGAFLIFEKVRAPDARFQDMMTQIYTEFKLSKNFSADEIVNKSRSLKGVLEPFSTKENFNYLKRSGFKDAMTIFKYITFEGILAIK